jgi:hypothetical protein
MSLVCSTLFFTLHHVVTMTGCLEAAALWIRASLEGESFKRYVRVMELAYA